MTKAFFSLLVAGPLALTVTVASAGVPVDNYSADAFATARYDVAVTQLEAQAKADPRDESALLNLALAYRHVGRGDEAQALYQRVLQLDDVRLETAKGPVLWAHDVARRGLNQNVRLTSR